MNPPPRTGETGRADRAMFSWPYQHLHRAADLGGAGKAPCERDTLSGFSERWCRREARAGSTWQSPAGRKAGRGTGTSAPHPRGSRLPARHVSRLHKERESRGVSPGPAPQLPGGSSQDLNAGASQRRERMAPSRARRDTRTPAGASEAAFPLSPPAGGRLPSPGAAGTAAAAPPPRRPSP